MAGALSGAFAGYITLNMSESTLASFAAVAVVALFALLLVRVLYRWTASTVLASFMVAVLALGGVLGIYFVDASIPLAESHFRPDGKTAPVWITLLAFGSRFAALFGVLYLGPWSPWRKAHA